MGEGGEADDVTEVDRDRLERLCDHVFTLDQLACHRLQGPLMDILFVPQINASCLPPAVQALKDRVKESILKSKNPPICDWCPSISLSDCLR